MSTISALPLERARFSSSQTAVKKYEQETSDKIHGFSVDLINGEFVADEALTRLMPLINNQLSFHSLRNFNYEEYTGVKDPEALSDLEVLVHFKNTAHNQLNRALRDGKTVKLKAHIEFSVS